MKINPQHISGIALTATMLMASCASEPLAGPDTNELYTRQFIKDFGVPAAGHDFSMATSAGLQVKASRPTSVVVTAVVDGKEYLFANLTVGEGTTELPVTIPRSVSQLNIKTPAGQITAGVNNIVDLDAITLPQSRAVEYTRDIQGQFMFNSDYSDSPVITFKVSDFLKDFFKDNPQGEHNTDYWYEGKDTEEGMYNPELRLDPSQVCTFSETVLKDADKKAEYYVFPIYWRTNKTGYKNYDVVAVNWNYLIMDSNFAQGELFDPSKMAPNKPFPQLYYSEESIAPADVFGEDMTLNAKLKTDDGTFSESYPLDELSDDATIVSYGTRLKFSKDESSLVFLLTSGTSNDPQYSFSSPAFNYTYWTNNRYFDETVSNLMFCYASTKIYQFGTPDYTGVDCFRFNLIQDSSTSTEFELEEHSKPFILGFDTPAQQAAADGTKRDYSDVLLLFIPVGTGGVQFDHCYVEKYPPYEWVVGCEDLGGSFDWDFNDAVFTFTDVIESLGSVNKNYSLTYNVAPKDAACVRRISVKPLAAGGTMPLYITFTAGGVGQFPEMPSEGDMMYSDANAKIVKAINDATDGYAWTYVVGTELHKWLGGSTHERPINVGHRHTDYGAEAAEFMVPATKFKPFHTPYLIYHGVSGTNSTLKDYNQMTTGGFALLVDKENTLGIDARNDVDRGFVRCPQHFIGYTYFIGAPNENKGDVAPQMIVVPGDWEWPREMVNIKDAYPGFYDWLANPYDHDWFRNNPNRGNVTAR